MLKLYCKFTNSSKLILKIPIQNKLKNKICVINYAYICDGLGWVRWVEKIINPKLGQPNPPSHKTQPKTLDWVKLDQFSQASGFNANPYAFYIHIEE